MEVRDRGAALVLTILIALAIVGAATVSVVPVLDTLFDRQRAHSGADAAALAGVTGGQGAAAEVAAANGGVLVAWSRDGRQVTVTVQVDGQRVTARATDEP
jgi:predicted MarR family transcription regulator